MQKSFTATNLTPKSAIYKLISYGVLYLSLRTFVGSFSGFYPLTRGVTVFELGLIKTYLSVLIIILDIPTSYYLSKYNSRIPLMIGAASAAVYFFVLYFSNSFLMFLFAETFNAIVLTLFSGVFISTLYSLCKREGKEFSDYNAKFNSLNHLGMLATAMAGSLMAFYMSSAINISQTYALIYLFSASLYVLLLFSGHWLIKGENLYRLAYAQNKSYYSMLSIIKSISRMSNKTQVNIAFLVVNGLIFNITLQIWQPLIYTLDPRASSLLLFSFFSAIMIVQSLSTSRFITHKFVILVSVVNVICLSILYLIKLKSNAIIILLIGFSISSTFFLVRYFYVNIESAVITDLPLEFQSTWMSFIKTVEAILSILLIPLSLFAIGKTGYTAFTVMFGLVGLLFVALCGLAKNSLK